MIIDAVLAPPEIDLLPQRDLSKTVCVVFDVLRATSSIITGLANGAQEIRPVSTIEDALAARAEWPDAVLGGERFGNRIEGFDLGNSPLEYCRPGLRRIVTTTTNGTVALRACAGAKTVLVGALLNMGALVARLSQTAPERALLVCAGTFRDLALEDVLAAGLLAAAFPLAEKTDACEAALATYEKYAGDLLGALQKSVNGKKLISDGRAGDVEWCARFSCYSTIGTMRDGVIRCE